MMNGKLEEGIVMMFFSCFLSYECVKLLLGHILRMKNRCDLWERFVFICLRYLSV